MQPDDARSAGSRNRPRTGRHPRVGLAGRSRLWPASLLQSQEGRSIRGVSAALLQSFDTGAELVDLCLKVAYPVGTTLVGRFDRLALDEPINVLSTNANAAIPDSNCWEPAGVDVVPDGLLVQPEQLRDLSHGHELTRTGLI